MNFPSEHNGPWVLAYFRQIYQSRVEITPSGVQYVPISDRQVKSEHLHLAWSRDALHWTPLGDNQPTWPEQWLRDPFIGRGPNGEFHLLATGETEKGCLYARSSDLVSWESRVLPLIEGVPEVNNVWAPEWVFDAKRGEYLMFWSSATQDNGWDDSRIWCARTKDFQSISPPRVLLDPGYTVIDATIVAREGEWHMFFKDERFGYKHGEHRFIRHAVAPALDGPYQIEGEPLTPQLSEGPAVVQAGEKWLMLYDKCMAGDYAALSSTNLRDWTPEPGANFPPEARHASTVPVSEAELQALITRFGGESS